MITFSADPQLAERQMHAIIFYLTTFGYIDGDFDNSEREFIRRYIRQLVTHRVLTGAADASKDLQIELTAKYTKHFGEVFAEVDRHVKDLFTEAVAEGEEQDKFVHAKLKVRCFEFFESFDKEGQEALMECINELMMADGNAHPAEIKFRAELSELLEAELDVKLIEEDRIHPVNVSNAVEMNLTAPSHPFFDQFEYHYSRDPEKMSQQVASDLALVRKAIDQLKQQKQLGHGKLSGKQKVSEFEDTEFLDQHVYLVAPQKHDYELLVLGDLHGCYSCLKAAVNQSQFFEKLEAFRKDPEQHLEPKLVFLGDYIDRGMFSLNGVLRAVLEMYLHAPEHVYVLRGNHEYFLEYQGQVYGGVKPSETINSLKPHLPTEVFRQYIELFENLPNMLFFEGMLFVHGGIARDATLKEKYKDLSSLNDPDIRFEMMWSDPSVAEVIPAELQKQSARFAFGRSQAAFFLKRVGCHSLVRGHEKIEEGFRAFEDESIALFTLFSAGGCNNRDLPENSGYRSVTPMAMTVTYRQGELSIRPWKIDYESFNTPERNAFFKSPPEINHLS
ncbi:MAG: serine/threonine protein phosphatase [Myxococcales bacterium]|nr:MAG: serine/threonine protein phosphatase [Myxococcales bacterium]